MSQFPIDVDAETIYFDGNWYGRDDLSRRIRAMLESGDYNIARPSSALEALAAELRQVRTLSLRCPAELADALAQLAARTGQSTGELVREAITAYLTDVNYAPAKGSVAASAAQAPEELPKVIVEPELTSVPVAGPGALRAAGVLPETPKK